VKFALVLGLALAAFAFAQLYTWLALYKYPFVAVEVETDGYWDGRIAYRVLDPLDRREFALWDPTYVVSASALAPNGSLVERCYTTATALVEAQPLNVLRDVAWYRLAPFGPEYKEKLRFAWGLHVMLQIGPTPNFSVIRLWPMQLQLFEADVNVKRWEIVFKNWEWTKKTKYLEVKVVYVIDEYGESYIVVWVLETMPRCDCLLYPVYEEKIPVRGRFFNFTVSTYDWGAAVYVNGTPVLLIKTKKEAPPTTAKILDQYESLNQRPWICVGRVFSWGRFGPVSAYISFGTSYNVGVPLKYAGRVALFVGNGTVGPPRFVYAVGRYDGVWLYADPPLWRPSPEWQPRLRTAYLENPVVRVWLNETAVEVVNGTVLPPMSCQTATAGRIAPAILIDIPAAGYYAALGPGRLYCRTYRVTVHLPNGTRLTFEAEANSTFAWRPPPVLDLGNGTRLVEPRPVAVKVNYSDASVDVRYGAREYLIRFSTPLGVAEEWVREGANATYPGADVDLGNGTRLVVHLMSLPAHWPMTASPSYEVYYWVSVYTPLNKTEGWAKRGAFVNITLPQFVDLGNKTALRDPNGTCAFRVDKPKACAITYRERLYWVSVQAPFNKTEGWALEGSVVRLPEVFDMGNGTRWVGPGFYAVVDKPINATPAYRRQYYVEVAGVVEWRGWADEGSQIRLNETVVDGVRYVPAQPYIEVRGPASVKPRYMAYYYAQFSDVVGLPNPWASVELCDRRFAADEAGRVYAVVETDMQCEVRAEAPPLGPYSLAIIGVVAALAVVVAVRRLRKRK